ncbi:MAG: hypothetical protein MJ180_01055 [Candidatus Gastranaerophilales bacterium]|nr:hypothetical protein [Candidatus Gastranaerophilales bacterium]
MEVNNIGNTNYLPNFGIKILKDNEFFATLIAVEGLGCSPDCGVKELEEYKIPEELLGNNRHKNICSQDKITLGFCPIERICIKERPIIDHGLIFNTIEGYSRNYANCVMYGFYRTGEKPNAIEDVCHAPIDCSLRIFGEIINDYIRYFTTKH